MWCLKCDHDLAECLCPDLKERLEGIAKSEHVHIGAEYRQRIEEQAARNKQERAVAE